MPKRTSDTERLITFAMNASEDTLNSTIQTLTAIRNNKFPTEKKSRKARKPKEPAADNKTDVSKTATPRTPRKTANAGEPEATDRKCMSCGWVGVQLHPEPCPDCGEKTEVK